MFVDREEEAGWLATALQEGQPGFVRLWGRRRLGKTSLLRERLPGLVYLYVDESETAVQLPRLRRELAAQTGHDVDAGDWSEFFRGLADLDQVVAFDEFQRLLVTDKAAIAALQDAWDNHLRPRAKRLLLCGSSIGMMQRLVREKNAPLMGRFTAQLQLRPLAFEHVRLLHPQRSVEETLEWYGVFGGTPFYQEQAAGESVFDAIDHAFLAPAAPLLEEPENLLASELRQPSTYSAILQAIGAGYRRLGDVASALGRRSTAITPYVRVLIDDLAIIRKDDPVLGPKQSARYAFDDPFFRFYYAFIQPNLSSIHDGLVGPLREKLKAALPSFLGPVWEEVVRDALRRNAGHTWQGMDLTVDRIGAWWTRLGDHEIDVVAISDRHVILGSCKWRSTPMTQADLSTLEEAGRHFPSGRRTVTFLMASRQGFTDGLHDMARQRKNLVLLSVRDLIGS